MLCEMIINVNACNFFVFSLLLVFFSSSVSCFVCMFCAPTASRVRVYIIRYMANGGDKNKPVCFVLSSICTNFARK